MVDDPDRIALVGGYDSAGFDGPSGLGLLRADAGSGSGAGWRIVDTLAADRPNFGVYDSRRQIVYTSHSGQDYLSAIAVDSVSGRLRLLNTAPTGSVNPVHLAFSANARFLVTASFSSGHISVVEVQDSGELGRLVAAIPADGALGPLCAQSGSQPHQVLFAPGGAHLFVPDRGLDLIHVYGFDADSGRLSELPAAEARPGSGPRHMVFDGPDRGFVINELDNTLATYRWDAARAALSPVHVVSTIPQHFFGPTSGAGITLSEDGRYLFVSNRGHDSIARFSISDTSDEPVLLGWTPVGRTPRFIGVQPRANSLWVTAQDSDLVQVLRFDPATGDLGLDASMSFAAPTFVVFT